MPTLPWAPAGPGPDGPAGSPRAQARELHSLVPSPLGLGRLWAAGHRQAPLLASAQLALLPEPHPLHLLEEQTEQGARRPAGSFQLPLACSEGRGRWPRRPGWGSGGPPHVHTHTHRPETARTHAPPRPQGGRAPWGSAASREMEASFAPRGARGQGRPRRPGRPRPGARGRRLAGKALVGKAPRPARGIRPPASAGSCFSPPRPHRARGRGCRRCPAALGPIPNPRSTELLPEAVASVRPPGSHPAWPQRSEAWPAGSGRGRAGCAAWWSGSDPKGRGQAPFPPRGRRLAERGAARAAGAGSSPLGARRFAAPGPGPGLREPPPPPPPPPARLSRRSPGPGGLAGRWRRRWRRRARRGRGGGRPRGRRERPARGGDRPAARTCRRRAGRRSPGSAERRGERESKPRTGQPRRGSPVPGRPRGERVPKGPGGAEGAGGGRRRPGGDSSRGHRRRAARGGCRLGEERPPPRGAPAGKALHGRGSEPGKTSPCCRPRGRGHPASATAASRPGRRWAPARAPSSAPAGAGLPPPRRLADAKGGALAPTISKARNMICPGPRAARSEGEGEGERGGKVARSPFVNFSLTFAFRSPPPPALPLRPPPRPPPRASGSRARAPDEGGGGGGGGSAGRGPAPSGSARPCAPSLRAEPGRPGAREAEQPPEPRRRRFGGPGAWGAPAAPRRAPLAPAPRPRGPGRRAERAGDLLLASFRALALDRMVSAGGISLLLLEPRSSHTLSSSPQHCQFGHLRTCAQSAQSDTPRRGQKNFAMYSSSSSSRRRRRRPPPPRRGIGGLAAAFPGFPSLAAPPAPRPHPRAPRSSQLAL